MTTQAQITANRRNAQKSTGPKTAEGKTVVAQNAVKHGLFARENVIKCEKQADFDHFRAELLAGLKPVEGVEAMLAERVVSLSWRLRRAERMSREAIDVMIARAETNRWQKQERKEAGLLDRKAGRSELVLGWATIKDFSDGQVLERLLMYEKRIESSLYKAMAELQKLQRLRKTEQAEAAEPEPVQPSLRQHSGQAPSQTDEATTPSEDQTAQNKKQTQFTILTAENAEFAEQERDPGLSDKQKQTQSCFSAAYASTAVNEKQSQIVNTGTERQFIPQVRHTGTV